MKIAFGEVGRMKIRHTIENQDWEMPEGTQLNQPVTAEVMLQLTNELTVTLEGNIKGSVELACARCGDKVEINLSEDFVYLITTGEEELPELEDKECSDEECNTLFLKEPFIDIVEILQEQLFLAVPGTAVCSVECRGLCQRCGGSLDRNECSCGEPELDSPFAVLKKLKKQ